MAKSGPAATPADAIIKALAQRFGLSRKTLKKAVQDETIRLIAERIAREQLDSAWQEASDLAGQRKKKRKSDPSKSG